MILEIYQPNVIGRMWHGDADVLAAALRTIAVKMAELERRIKELERRIKELEP